MMPSENEMDNIHCLSCSREADGNAFQQPEKSQNKLPVGDRGAIVDDLKPWYTLVLDRDFKIISGKGHLDKYAPAESSDNFLDFLDENGKSDFKKVVAGLRPDRIFTRYFVLADRHPLEMLIVVRNAGYDLLYRSTAQKPNPLKRMSLLYRHFLTSAEGAVFVDPDGDIIDANRSFLNLYGYTLDEVTGRNLTILTPNPHQASNYNEMWRCLTDKDIGSWTGEMTNCKKNGDEVTVLLSASSIFDSSANVVGYISHHHDITERKKHEEALRKRDVELEMKNRELEKLNQLKSDLMAITSHDLKSPIAAMIGYADLIKGYMDQMPKEKIRHYLDRVMDAGHRQLKFINDLLDLYKFESDAFVLDKKPVRLDELLAETVEINTMAGKIKSVKIDLVIEAGPDLVMADGVRMQQVFNNLLSNAVKFSSEGAQIDVHYRKTVDNRIRVTVDDQGPGIAETDRERIFDRYYQIGDKENGSERLHGAGLGLYIARHIVGFHDGTLRVENRPDRGCRFIMEIPLAEPEKSQAPRHIAIG